MTAAKLTESRIARIEEAISLGATKEVAARHGGLNPGTIRRHLKRARDLRESGVAPSNREERRMAAFLDRIEEAEVESEIRLSGNIMVAAETDWRAAAWILPRRFPERWAEKPVSVEVTGPDGGPVRVEQSHVLASLAEFAVIIDDDVEALDDPAA